MVAPVRARRVRRPAGAVSPSTASADVVVTTFANSICPLMCLGRPAIVVLFVFDTWQPAQFVPNSGPNAELRWSVWFAAAGAARWQNPHPAIAVPHVYVYAGANVAPLPSLWHAFAPHEPNAVG